MPDTLATLPADPALGDINFVFEPDWIRSVYDELFPDDDDEPNRLRPRRLAYRLGKRALVTYVAQRRIDDWLLEDEFAAELLVGEEHARAFKYPLDPYLPGLRAAGSATEAHSLLAQYVRLRPRRLRVELVRYRPSNRAVLKYAATLDQDDRVSLFARAMRPRTVARFVAAGTLVSQSAFVVPSLEGCWDEGGIVWLGRLPGATVREHINRGTGPEPDQILDAIESVWKLPTPKKAPSIDVRKGLAWTVGYLSHLLQGRDGAKLVVSIGSALEPLAASWRPTGTAQNDFYDDQMLVLPSGDLALADFEECGVGDSMIDIANFVAHLTWSTHVGRQAHTAAYAERLRATALRRFGWDEQQLRLREAYCLFRLATNPVRGLRPTWRDETERVLELVQLVLDGRIGADRSAAA